MNAIEHKNKIQSALKILYTVTKGIYFVRDNSVKTLKVGPDSPNLVLELVVTWRELLKNGENGFKLTVVIDAKSFIWYLRYTSDLSAIAVRLDDDSKLFTVSFAANELLEALTRTVPEKSDMSVHFIDNVNLIKLRHEFYDFIKEHLGMNKAVKYAKKIYALDKEHSIENWQLLIVEIEKDARHYMGPFIAKGIAMSLRGIVERHFKKLTLNGGRMGL